MLAEFCHQFSSVTQLCPTVCDPMNCSTPGLPVHHHLPEFTQTHLHRVCDAIQPSHPRLAHCLEHSFAVELFQILKGDAVKVLHSICQQIWKTQQWPQDWKWSVFIPIPKKGNAKECLNYHTIALFSNASKGMLKILQARLQLYVNRKLPDVQAGFRKGRGTRHQIASIRWIMEKARAFPKNIYFCFIDYAKAFDCVDHNKLWTILKEMGILDHLAFLLRNLYAGQ